MGRRARAFLESPGCGIRSYFARPDRRGRRFRWRSPDESLQEERVRPARGDPDREHRPRGDPGGDKTRLQEAAGESGGPRCCAGQAREGDLGRGHHRVPARKRPARAALPRSHQGHDHGQHHLHGRLPKRELRRDRDGAPARAPRLQGHAQPPQHPSGADRARRAAERLDVVRPYELLRDLPGDRREPQVGARPRSRPDDQLLHRQEGPRQRDDGGPQRVRARRERPGLDPRGARPLDGLPLAQLRPFHDRRKVRPRERADRPPPELLPDVLPAGQRRPARRRKVRRGERRSSSSTRSSGRSRSRGGRYRPSTRSTRRRTASA